MLVEETELDAAIETYRKRFPAFAHLIQQAEDFERDITDLRLYSIQVERVRLIDETRFGHRNWITFPVIQPQPQAQAERQPGFASGLVPML